jgi:hypothetical protein
MVKKPGPHQSDLKLGVVLAPKSQKKNPWGTELPPALFRGFHVDVEAHVEVPNLLVAEG